MKLFLFVILLIGFQIPSWASSGVAPFWLYQTTDGKYMARMSDQAEQDDYNGVTQGAVKSKFLVYKMMNRNIPKKQAFVTTSICESFRNDPRGIKCGIASGPFSGATYKLSSNYEIKEAGKGRFKPKLAEGKKEPTQLNSAMLLVGEYVKSKGYMDSGGLSIFNCVEGCKSIGTPAIMIQIDLIGD